MRASTADHPKATRDLDEIDPWQLTKVTTNSRQSSGISPLAIYLDRRDGGSSSGQVGQSRQRARFPILPSDVEHGLSVESHPN